MSGVPVTRSAAAPPASPSGAAASTAIDRAQEIDAEVKKIIDAAYKAAKDIIVGSADKLELIFERFQQVDASDAREKGGSGLGLPICRSIVRQHGGEISVESELGRGSRFRFAIPLLAVAVPRSAHTVLVCDDDEAIRDMMTALLEKKGHRAVAVGSS